MSRQCLSWSVFGGIMSEGLIWGPKWLYFLHAPRVWAPWLAGFKLSSDFNAAELETGKLGPPASAAAAWTLLFEQPYAVSDQPEHKIEIFFVFWSPYNKYRIWKNNGAKRASDRRDLQINVPFPLESTQGTNARRVLLILSFCTQGDLFKSEHMLG